ncbi:TSUP family transporter [Hymenobacter lutimineralis]|uniref:Probable membrane transporter protein n=1 Tax=Hymenobacter lutimineralis TaxID=2606448 RepID=A0A5D6VH87_9BACT|nr:MULTISPECIES: TSUP family transporter [Hymenobacter]QIX60104.1 TSUP family transporter [Hymenobacter sp. BT18]TYZ14462.1 TSUP family transporter [Hymenobacter lutimineralis]
MISTLTIALLCGAAFLAGLVDAIVGGGGLIQLPAMLLLLKGTPVPTILGTGKVSSLMGTAAALRRYAGQVPLQWRAVGTAAAVAGLFSFLGARVVSMLPQELLPPLVLGLLVVIALYTFWRKDFGSLHAPRLTPSREMLYGVLIGSLIGFYDGFFGPGTGSFLLFAFVGLFGYDFITSSASAKLVNVATNLAALGYFAYTGQILWSVALPMAVSNILGSTLGAHLALRHGTGFVRGLFLVVVSAFIIKLSMQVFGG